MDMALGVKIWTKEIEKEELSKVEIQISDGTCFGEISDFQIGLVYFG